MQYIMIGAIVFIMSVTVLLPGYVSIRNTDRFYKNRKFTEGIIIGYRRNGNIMYNPTVSVKLEGKDESFRCRARMNYSKTVAYPVGTRIKISYMYREAFGTTFYDARVEEEGICPIPEKKINTVIIIVGMVILCISAALFIIGALSFF